MPGKASLEEYCRRALARGASWARLAPASYIVTAPWVLHKCRFGCGGYDRGLLCPPRTPTPEETARVIASYDRAILITYDSDGPGRKGAWHNKMHRDLVALEREIFLDGYERATAFGAGPCDLCKTCDVTKPCPRPGDTRPALEACGIDVYTTFARAGVQLEVVRDPATPFKLCAAILME